MTHFIYSKVLAWPKNTPTNIGGGYVLDELCSENHRSHVLGPSVCLLSDPLVLSGPDVVNGRAPEASSPTLAVVGKRTQQGGRRSFITSEYEKKNILRFLVSYADGACEICSEIHLTPRCRSGRWGNWSLLAGLRSLTKRRVYGTKYIPSLLEVPSARTWLIEASKQVSLSLSSAKRRLSEAGILTAYGEAKTEDFLRLNILFIPYALAFGIFYTLFPLVVRGGTGVNPMEFSCRVSDSGVGGVQGASATAGRPGNFGEVVAYESLRIGHYSSKLFILWSFLKIWKGIRPSSAYRSDYSIEMRLISPRQNKKRLKDVQGIDKFLPVLKTLVDCFKQPVAFDDGYTSLSRMLRDGISCQRWQGSGIFCRSAWKREQTTAVQPKAYVFIGSPGTGKTLLAQAVAGEASVNLLCLSASEIQKQIDIGTRIGALRVRNLFEDARKNTPCILFLDEIDSIAASRKGDEGVVSHKGLGSAFGRSASQHKAVIQADTSVLTEFLIQMDNFSVEDGFILIGTTNFLSNLDGAFIRSGRFDRILGLQLPSKKTRIALLEMYIEKSGLGLSEELQASPRSVERRAEENDWDKLASKTKGFTAADLSKIVNESSLYILRCHKSGTAEDLCVGTGVSDSARSAGSELSARRFPGVLAKHSFKSLVKGIEKISTREKYGDAGHGVAASPL